MRQRLRVRYAQLCEIKFTSENERKGKVKYLFFCLRKSDFLFSVFLVLKFPQLLHGVRKHKVVVHFYRSATWRCQVVDRRLEELAATHLETRVAHTRMQLISFFFFFQSFYLFLRYCRLLFFSKIQSFCSCRECSISNTERLTYLPHFDF